MLKQGDVVQDFTILQAIHLGDKELIIGEKLDADYRYMVGEYFNNGIFEGFENVQVSNDYISILESYSNRIKEQVNVLIEKRTDFKPISTGMYNQITPETNLEGAIVVMDLKKLYRECQTPENQLYFAKSGFGTQPNSRGRAIFATNLYTMEEARFNRDDFIGVMYFDKLPEWAKNNYASLVSENQKEQFSVKGEFDKLKSEKSQGLKQTERFGERDGR